MALSGQLKALYGPAYLANSIANVYNQTSALLFTVMKHIHIANVTASAATVTLYIGATGGSAGGTEIFKGLSIPANSSYDYYCNRKLLSTDFLSGLSNTASALVIDIEGEQVVV
jgi:hypothetical protein